MIKNYEETLERGDILEIEQLFQELGFIHSTGRALILVGRFFAGALSSQELIKFIRDGTGTAQRMLKGKALRIKYARRDKINSALRTAVYERDGYACLVYDATTLLCCDHVLPYSRGGDTSLANLQTLCRTCNLRKGTKTQAEFIAYFSRHFGHTPKRLLVVVDPDPA